MQTQTKGNLNIRSSTMLLLVELHTYSPAVSLPLNVEGARYALECRQINAVELTLQTVRIANKKTCEEIIHHVFYHKFQST